MFQIVALVALVDLLCVPFAGRSQGQNRYDCHANRATNCAKQTHKTR